MIGMVSSSRQVPNVTYEILKSRHVEEAVSVVTRAFQAAEPLNRVNNIPYETWASSCRRLCEAVVKDGLSIVAVDGSTDRLVGAVICGDLASPKPDFTDLHSRFAVTSALLGELGKEYRQSIHLFPHRYLHILLLAVDLDFGGRGIGTHLIGEALLTAKKKGFQRAVCESTSVQSQYVFRAKSGFVDKFSIPYEEWEYQGRKVFESIQGQSAILMEKEIV